MILIEEDEDKINEASSVKEGSMERKENRNNNIQFQKKWDNGNHGIKFEIQNDERVAKHLQKEPKNQLNLLFYDFNSSPNPYEN